MLREFSPLWRGFFLIISVVFGLGNIVLLWKLSTIPFQPSSPDFDIFPPGSEMTGRFAVSSTLPRFKLFVHPLGDLVSDVFLYHGMWPDCLDVGNLLHAFKSTKLAILEIGSNIGTCSLYFASQGHQVIGFEPVRANYKLLLKSIQMNPTIKGKVTLFPFGASDKAATRKIQTEKGNFGNSVIGEQLPPTLEVKFGLDPPIESTVQLKRIDSLVHEHIDLLKLDCQGHELNAVLGAMALFEAGNITTSYFEYAPVWIEANGANPQRLLDFFSEHGFVLFHRQKIIQESDFGSFTKKIQNSTAGFTDIFAVHRTFLQSIEAFWTHE